MLWLLKPEVLGLELSAGELGAISNSSRAVSSPAKPVFGVRSMKSRDGV
jgi:hypothetical protein